MIVVLRSRLFLTTSDAEDTGEKRTRENLELVLAIPYLRGQASEHACAGRAG